MRKSAQRLLYLSMAFGLTAFTQIRAQKRPSNFNNCDRYQVVLGHLLKDPDVGKFFQTEIVTFDISSKVSLSGVSWPMQRQYVAGYLNISIDSVNRNNPAMTALVDSLYGVVYSNKSAIAECLISKKNVNGNVSLSFSVDEVSVTAHLESKVEGYKEGMIYLFFIDTNNRIKKFFKSSWQE